MIDTATEWAVSIPTHWRAPRIKNVARVKGRIGWHGLRSDDFTDEGNYLITGTDLINGKVDLGSTRFVDDRAYERDPHIQLRSGDVLLTKDGTIGKAAIVGQLPGRATLNSGLFVVRPLGNAWIPRFMYWVLASPLLLEFVGLRAGGSTINHLYQETFYEFRMPLPPLEDQRRIADFLDRETARIDALVEKKRRVIDLLEEKQTALVTQAVTKGLDPSVPMKDSGVEWLGEVPASWDLAPLKRFVPEVTVGIVVQPARLYADSGVPCLRGLNIDPGNVATDQLVYVSPEANLEHGKSILRAGDVVVVRTGKAGAAAIVPGWAIGGNCVDLLIVRTSARLGPQYLEYWLNSELTTMQVDQGAVGAIQSHYNVEALKDLLVLLPPPPVQSAILTYLDSKAGAMTVAVSRLAEQIDLLAEYREALITAAVTGELDVDTFDGDRGAEEVVVG